MAGQLAEALGGRPASPPGGGDLPLVDLVDRLLETGAAVSGDVLLSVAGTDLVWLSLRAVLKGIDEPLPGLPSRAAPPAPGTEQDDPGPRPATREGGSPRTPAARRPRQARTAGGKGTAARSARGAHRSTPGARATASGPPRISIEEGEVERGLVQLVLTVVELLRELMERQALRRIEGPGLADEQVEQLGLAFMRLNERMQDLKEEFGLTDDDLRPRLGTVADLG